MIIEILVMVILISTNGNYNHSYIDSDLSA